MGILRRRGSGGCERGVVRAWGIFRGLFFGYFARLVAGVH